MLKGKKILLGITGSIAAYKSALLCREFIKNGCEVKVVMTPAACDFITPLTLSTLSQNDVFTTIAEQTSWNNHVALGMWADIMIVAPTTATTIGKMAHGIADNILLVCYLSAKCQIMVAPAMDLDMWRHPSTINNINLLKSFGNIIIPVGNGFLASGLEGEGRMAEPLEIIDFVEKHFRSKAELQGKNILITAGPTYEAIDPVRFIGNRSSGKMGYALANECAARGANVTLVLGPVNLPTMDDLHIKTVKVESAQQMYEAVESHYSQQDVIILAAAVADYKSSTIATQKLKKKDEEMYIHLEKTIDIASTIGQKKGENQILVGFALETNDEIEHAKQKLYKKNLDLIVLNSLSDHGAGFQHDTNKISILQKDEDIQHFELKSKAAVAKDIVDTIIKKIKSKE